MYYFIKSAMFSKILIKLIDQAIVPAILLLAVRFVSVTLVAKYYKIPIDITAAGFNLPAESYARVNSYSILIMILVLTVGLLYILFKSFVLHDSHISPSLTAKVFSLRLSAFIQNSFDLYSQGAIWLSYSYLLMLVTGLMALFNLTYVWIFVTSLVLTIFSTIMFVLDIENELGSKQSQSTGIEEEVVLNFSDKEGQDE